MTRWNTLEVEKTDRYIWTLVLNRPAQRNAINRELAHELAACLTELQDERELRVLLVTGRGTAFCAGGDLKERLAGHPRDQRLQREAALRAIDLLDRFPAAVIAMVNGPAMAGGLEIALGCDVRIASEQATFGLPEVRSVGAFPGAGACARLPKMIGRGRASLVVLTGRTFSAAEALDLGFVEQVVAHERLLEQTLTIARDIARGSPLGVRAAKQLIRQSVDLDVSSATDLSRALRDPLDDTADFREGIAAWRDKRTPDFTGK